MSETDEQEEDIKEQLKLFVPPYPAYLPLMSLFALNLTFAMISITPLLFRMFTYLYGCLLLFPAYKTEHHLKITLIVNSVILWSYWQETYITNREERICFFIIFLIYSKVILFVVREVLESLLVVKEVTFDHVFWAIQAGIIADFLYGLTGISWLKGIPSSLRIAQNLRIFTRESLLGAIRFSLALFTQLFVPFSETWIFLRIIESLWKNQVDYTSNFEIRRVFGFGVCIYPPRFILFVFCLITLFEWSWLYGGVHTDTYTILKRCLWNYLRLETRVARTPVKFIFQEILSIFSNSNLNNELSKIVR